MAKDADQIKPKTTKQTYGYIERVELVEHHLSLVAKLDTGAKSASLNAKSIREVEKDGKPYLAFVVPDKAGDQNFFCEYLGNVNIKMRAGESRIAPVSKKSISRPVVRMAIKIGNEVRTIRVNLTNRKRFLYPLLLGREAIIAFNGVIDPSQTFTVKQGKA